MKRPSPAVLPPTLLCLCLVSCAPLGSPNEAPDGEERILGVTYSIPSAVYGADQRITVSLPAGYRSGTDRYPVVFATHSRFAHLAGALDDLGQNQVPEAILVYLETYDSGDFLPTAIPSRPGSGGADQLVRFFADDLIPYIERRYRTRPFRIFHSGSWGGVFCLYALVSAPDVFQGCIASTPWVIYDGDEHYLVREVGELVRRGRFKHNFLFVALGNDPDPGLREGVESLADTVRRLAPRGLEFEYRYEPGEDHYSVGHKAFFDGLRWMFSAWNQIPDETLEQGRTGVEAYLRSLKDTYGFPIGVHWGPLYSRGFRLLNAGDPAGARTMFELCAEVAPEVPACMTGLGRSHEAAGALEEARAAYRRALELAEAGGDPDLARYRDALERVS